MIEQHLATKVNEGEELRCQHAAKNVGLVPKYLYFSAGSNT